MLKSLLCKLNLGHHWLLEEETKGTFRRRCTRCGKYDQGTQTWSGHLNSGDRPPQHDSRKYY